MLTIAYSLCYTLGNDFPIYRLSIPRTILVRYINCSCVFRVMIPYTLNSRRVYVPYLRWCVFCVGKKIILVCVLFLFVLMF